MMKKICYYTIFCILSSCGKDEIETREIKLSYDETEIETTFRTPGSIAPTILDWDGEPGVFSISSSTEILEEDFLSFDSQTGHFSWGKDFPIGIYDFTITAQSGEATATIEILLTNRFIKGFFSGGFNKVDDPDDLTLTVFIDYGLQLTEDGSISMKKYSDPTFQASGNWSITEEGILSIVFISNLSGGEATYMRGFLSFDPDGELSVFRGEYGPTLDENQGILTPTGIFSFFWD